VLLLGIIQWGIGNTGIGVNAHTVCLAEQGSQTFIKLNYHLIQIQHDINSFKD
jgi:hypothetical protein